MDNFITFVLFSLSYFISIDWYESFSSKSAKLKYKLQVEITNSDLYQMYCLQLCKSEANLINDIEHISPLGLYTYKLHFLFSFSIRETVSIAERTRSI